MDKTLIKFDKFYTLQQFGLYNNNIICYFNSLLQSLFSCTSITEYLLNNEEKFGDNNFIRVYINILKKYIIINKSNIGYIIEQSNLILFNEFLVLIKNKNIHFGYNQEDSGELLLLLLDVIDDKYIYNLFYNKYKCDFYCKLCKNMTSIKDDISIQFEICPETIESSIIKSNLTENLHTLNQYITNNYSECDDFLCSYCKKSGACIKINRLLLAPSIVVINLNKYSEKKIYKYPTELFFINTTEHKKYNYKLISSIHHSGNMNFGHYISNSIRKNTKNNKISHDIFELNDSSYQIGSFKPDKNAYILFYHYSDSIEYF